MSIRRVQLFGLLVIITTVFSLGISFLVPTHIALANTVTTISTTPTNDIAFFLPTNPTGEDDHTKHPISLHIGESWYSHTLGKWLRGHMGTDFTMRQGEPVYAAADGVIVLVRNYYKCDRKPGTCCNNKEGIRCDEHPGQQGCTIEGEKSHGWGPTLVIKHENKSGFFDSTGTILPSSISEQSPKVVYTQYGHLDSVAHLYEGQVVKSGQQLGIVGKLCAYSAHLHFAIKSEEGFTLDIRNSAGKLGFGYSGVDDHAPNHYNPPVFIKNNRLAMEKPANKNISNNTDNNNANNPNQSLSISAANNKQGHSPYFQIISIFIHNKSGEVVDTGRRLVSVYDEKTKNYFLTPFVSDINSNNTNTNQIPIFLPNPISVITPQAETTSETLVLSVPPLSPNPPKPSSSPSPTTTTKPSTLVIERVITNNQPISQVNPVPLASTSSLITLSPPITAPPTPIETLPIDDLMNGVGGGFVEEDLYSNLQITTSTTEQQIQSPSPVFFRPLGSSQSSVEITETEVITNTTTAFSTPTTSNPTSTEPVDISNSSTTPSTTTTSSSTDSSISDPESDTISTSTQDNLISTTTTDIATSTDDNITVTSTDNNLFTTSTEDITTSTTSSTSSIDTDEGNSQNNEESPEPELEPEPEETPPTPTVFTGSPLAIFGEIAWMGTLASPNDEWIEVLFIGNGLGPQSLLGYKLQFQYNPDTEQFERELVFPDVSFDVSISIPIAVLFERTDDNTVSNYPADGLFTGAIRNEGDRMRILSPDNLVIDEFDFLSGWPAGDNNTKETMVRKLNFSLYEAIEFIEYGPANDPTSWCTFSACQETEDYYEMRNGTDANGNPILGSAFWPTRITLGLELEMFL